MNQLMTATLQNYKNSSDANVKIIPLTGDASPRKYFRVQHAQGTAILQLTDPFEQKNEFLKVHSFLEKNGIAVPKIFAIESTEGAVLQEDLGDDTMLLQLIRNPYPEFEKECFERALTLLADLHERAIPSKFSGKEVPVGFSQSFDVEKLMWEVNFTLEHFYGGYLQKNFSHQEAVEVKKIFTTLCEKLAAEPRVYTHRDYHTRNIMVSSGQMYMIDFQDARMGLRQYDLASLLRDSYYRRSEEQVYDSLDYYLEVCKKLGAKDPTGGDKTHFIKIFDLMSIQRNFKALGTFGYQFSVKKNPFYLRFVGNTFENIRWNLNKYSELKDLGKLLLPPYFG